MNLYAKPVSVLFAAVGMSLLGCFFFSPWREKQFDDFVAISSDTVDLGQVVCFEKGQGEFTLTNLTNSPIPFRIDADCSCTTITLPTGVIEPQASHIVKFTYLPKSIPKLDSSLQQEVSDITVSLLAKDQKFSRLVAVRAEGIFPAILSGFSLLASVEPMQQSQVLVPFSIAKDVNHVRLVSASDFLTAPSVDTFDGELAFRASVETAVGTHKGTIVLEFDVQSVNKPVRMELPMAVIVEMPYAFSSDVIALSPGSHFLLEVRPKFGAMRTEFIQVESDSPSVTAKMDGHALEISSTSMDEVSLPITGRLRVSLRVVYPDAREAIIEDDVPFIVSEGGS